MEGQLLTSCTAMEGKVELVKCLISHGSWVHVGEITPLHVACYEFSNLHTLRLLLDNGAVVNFQDTNSETALHYLCKKILLPGYAKAIEFLIQRGANVNIPNRNGYTPLITACRFAVMPHEDALRAVEALKHGANVHVLNRGEGVLEIVRADGSNFHIWAQEQLIDLILRYGAEESTGEKKDGSCGSLE